MSTNRRQFQLADRQVLGRLLPERPVLPVLDPLKTLGSARFAAVVQGLSSTGPGIGTRKRVDSKPLMSFCGELDIYLIYARVGEDFSPRSLSAMESQTSLRW